MNTHNMYMSKHFIPLISVSVQDYTGFNKNPAFPLYFMIQFQLPDTEKSIIFQPSSGNRR